ncbi:MAG: hypothetical protein E7600_01350 [Ruminococcaceae bacterium]|nr:hypothetical protein [Oscillospiraceae bacterium]
MKRIKQTILLLVLTILICTVTAFAQSPEITGTSVRIEEPVGIRVIAEIGADFAESSVEEYGFLVARKVFLTKDGLENTDLTLDSGVRYTKGISYGFENGEPVDRFFDKNDEIVAFAANAHGVPERFYSESLVVRPYAVLKDGSVSYGAPTQTSIYGEAKKLAADTDLYESLSNEQKALVYGVILAVEGEPYILNRDDFRIVLSSEVVKNENPSYSVSYKLFNPFTGEILESVKGRKRSKIRSEIDEMLLSSGCIVPVYDGVVQDTTEGYVVGNISDFVPMWIGNTDLDEGRIYLSVYDKTLACKDCIGEYISENPMSVSANINTPVSVFGGKLENPQFALSDMTRVVSKDKSLLCRNGDVYSDYVKAYVSIDASQNAEYIIVISDTDESITDEKCQKHTFFDVSFYIDGELYETRSVLFGTSTSLPEVPEKDGYTFLYWSQSENGEAVNVESEVITQSTTYYAVFEKNPVYYEVKFIVNGEEYASQQVLEGECSTLPQTPEKDGYTFLYWSQSENGEPVDVESNAITQNTSYHAVFKKNPVYYEVKFTVDGEEYVSVQVLEGECPTLPQEPQLEGYAFLGWSISENGAVVYPEDIPVNSDAVYFAVFEKLIVYHSVTFIFDGQILTEYKVLSGDAVNAPENVPETAEEYKFMGWSMENDNDRTGIIDVSSVTIESDTVFYSVIITNPNSEEFMLKINKGYDELDKIKRVTGNAKKALTLIRDTIKLVIDDANDFKYVDRNYVIDIYGDKIEEVKKIIKVDMTEAERSQFANLIKSNVTDEVEEFLKVYFKFTIEI